MHSTEPAKSPAQQTAINACRSLWMVMASQPGGNNKDAARVGTRRFTEVAQGWTVKVSAE